MENAESPIVSYLESVELSFFLFPVVCGRTAPPEGYAHSLVELQNGGRGNVRYEYVRTLSRRPERVPVDRRNEAPRRRQGMRGEACTQKGIKIHIRQLCEGYEPKVFAARYVGL